MTSSRRAAVRAAGAVALGCALGLGGCADAASVDPDTPGASGTSVTPPRGAPDGGAPDGGAPDGGASAGRVDDLAPQRNDRGSRASADEAGTAAGAPPAGGATTAPIRSPETPLPVARPIAVAIPAIEVDAELVGVGLRSDGAMETPPFGTAGWYELGPRPGAPGPAVIVAHYDSTDGPDVFFELGELREGDIVDVQHADGATSRFAVEQIEQHPKDALPGERIWAASDEPRLTLITCGGVFDRSSGHYLDNLVVQTRAAPS